MASVPPTDTSTMKLAVLPTIEADGGTQMGLDLALLDYAHETPDTIWLRSYTWSRPTLSLGYFQSWRDLPDAIKSTWADFAVVRRPSGGGAIRHEGDLTYAVVVPSGHPWTSSARRLYQAVHDALGSLMAADGAPVKRRQLAGGVIDSPSGPVSGGIRLPSPFLCFEDGDADDLVLDGAKIVGGAQRRRAWATLQHGSIHWQASRIGPTVRLPGLLDLCPEFREKSPVLWASTFGERLASAWALPFCITHIPAEVLLAAHAWSRRIQEPEWLNKR